MAGLPQYIHYDPVNATLVWLLVVLTPFALLTVPLNATRLSTARRRAVASRAGSAIGLAMIVLYVVAVGRWLAARPEPVDRFNVPVLGTTTRYLVDNPAAAAFAVIGAVCLVTGAVRASTGSA